ncbi:MAG TPA: DNA gyrase subunit A [Candidatus Babeliales bacterium]|nr:DNA gyrase subunit A [Candidatus Babeliales bacterium]
MERPTSLANNKNIPVRPILIEKELKDSFLDYAMSVVVSRALPDIRDGLKPVHRRILYTMHQLGFFYNKPYHKSVRVVGDVLGKFHPHGDQAVYQSMVGLIQNFSKRYPLLDGQGNWGSVDGDNAAAMRYTEVRMARIAQEILADIEKETVAFVPNFDESTVEPVVLPSKLPNLLINGVAGIAVGMATSIPPHHLGEVVNALLAMIKNEFMTDEELFAYIPGPDFPTGGVICGRAGIVKAYKTGRGNLILRGVTEFEEKQGKGASIIITQLPYQVNKADLTIKIADLVKNKIIDGISNIKDESDKKGMRLVIDLKRGEIPSVVLNQLYKHTNLQTSVSILMLGLLDNQPLIFTLRQLLSEFLYHRKQIIYRRTQYDLSRAQEREHILAGFIIGLNSIDEVIALIKKSPSATEAIAELNKRFLLTEKQGKAILEMRLQRLTGLEQEKIYAEMDEIKTKITYFRSILENETILKEEIIKELEDIKNNYNDERRTKIEGAIDILTEADLIPDEEAVITLTMKGYVKRVPLDAYGVQRRGGKGKMGLTALEGDIVQDVFVAKAHDMLLFFTNLGRVYSLNTFEVPEASRVARGRAIINLLPLQDGEFVVKLLPSRVMVGKFMVMVTREGVIKRTDAEDFAKIRATGIRAITLREGDELVFCSLSSGNDTIILATSRGQGIRFKETEVRSMGRQASGVMGIRVKKNDRVIGMEVVSDHGEILFATENGYGKKVRIADFRIAHRAGMGVRTIPTDKRNGTVIGLAIVHEDSNILLIDQAGKIIRLSAKDIRAMGRQAKGVRLIRLDSDQKLHNVVAFEGGDDSSADNSDDETGAIIETRSLPETEDAGDESDEEELEDEDDSDEEAPEDDIEYEEEDADDVDEDEEVEL